VCSSLGLRFNLPGDNNSGVGASLQECAPTSTGPPLVEGGIGPLNNSGVSEKNI